MLLVWASVLVGGLPVILAQAAKTSKDPKLDMASLVMKCEIPDEYKKKWTKPEQWAWKEICEGRDADFNERLGEKLDIKRLYRWSYDYDYEIEDDYRWLDGRRTLSPRFLKTILLEEQFRRAIPYRGVNIDGGFFKDRIDLSDASIEWPLVLKDSLFKSSVFMNRLETTKIVSFSGSRFDGMLSLNSVSIGHHFFMRKTEYNIVNLRGSTFGGQLIMTNMRNSKSNSWFDISDSSINSRFILNGSKLKGGFMMDSISVGGSLRMNEAEFEYVDLRGAKIGAQFSMRSSKFKKTLVLNAVSIGRELFMHEAEFEDVDLRGAKIGNSVIMEDSKFKGTLSMDSASIGSNCYMRSKAEFYDVELRAATIGDSLQMQDSVFKGKLDMRYTSIGLSIFMYGAKFDKPARLTFLSVGSNLDARGATLRGLNLRGTRIGGELQFGHRCKQGKASCKKGEREEMQWKSYKDTKGNFRNPELSLQNARVDALQDTENTWPDKLEREFEGFIYQRLGGLGMNKKETPYKRSSEWFINWLAKDKPYSPQPYRHLASVLRTAGYPWKADNILYAGRAREHRERKMSWSEWLFLWLLWIFIGYGYGLWNFVALAWVVFFVMVGTFFLRINEECYIKETCEEESAKLREELGFWYSLDMLLPVIQLREEHYKVDLTTEWLRRYFYVHKIIGYVLIFFVIAGLTGLTK